MIEEKDVNAEMASLDAFNWPDIYGNRGCVVCKEAARVNDNGVIRFYCRTIVVRCRRNDHNLQQLNVDTFEYETSN